MLLDCRLGAATAEPNIDIDKTVMLGFAYALYPTYALLVYVEGTGRLGSPPLRPINMYYDFWKMMLGLRFVYTSGIVFTFTPTNLLIRAETRNISST